MTTSTHPHAIGAVRPENWAYDRAPMIVYWELTNACGLACRHCRATAMPDPAPGELTLAEIEAHLDSFAGFGEPGPHIVFTGGDPLRRGACDKMRFLPGRFRVYNSPISGRRHHRCALPSPFRAA